MTQRTSFKCIDCRVNTSKIGEYYVVEDRVWEAAIGKNDATGMLCIGCLEYRLKRQLTFSDFVSCPANFFGNESSRKRMRMWDGLGEPPA